MVLKIKKNLNEQINVDFYDFKLEKVIILNRIYKSDSFLKYLIF